MRTTSKCALAALATAVSTTVFATFPTPVAVWDGDFKKEVSGYPIGTYDNQLSEDGSTITITNQYYGVDVNFQSPLTSGMTVMFKYANLEVGSKTKILVTSCVDSWCANDRTGVGLQPSGKLQGVWYNSGWSDYGDAANSVASSGCLVFTYKASEGTYLYYGDKVGSIGSSCIWGNSNLKSGTDTNLYGVTIGGMRVGNDNWRAAQDMTVTGIAVFDRVVSVSDLNEYVWPGTVQLSYSGDTSFSAINEDIAEHAEALEFRITLAANSTVAIDDALASSVPVYFLCSGSVKFSAESAPASTYYTNADFSGIEGALLRTWLPDPGVVGFNFNANGERDYASSPTTDGAADTSSALVEGTWYKDASSASGSSTAIFSDGLSTLTWSSANVYSDVEDPSGGTFLQGYLDDVSGGATITLSGVPYDIYDVVIYANTDTANALLKAKSVNGTSYTWNSSSAAVAEGTSAWGAAGKTAAVYGVNALRIKNLTGALTINGNGGSDGRGGISAIQIMPTNAADNVTTYTLDLDGTDATWSTAAWKVGGEAAGTVPTSGRVIVTASASTTLTIDTDVTLEAFTATGAVDCVVTVVTNGGSFVSGGVNIEGGVLKQGAGSVFGTTPNINVKEGGTFDMNALPISSATTVNIAGAGAGSWPWALTSSSGAGGNVITLALAADATIGGANDLIIGKDDTTHYCYLNGFTLTKTGAGALTCYDMNTPGTGTIDVYGGAMSVNKWNNLNNMGGTTTVILREGASLANNTDRVVPMESLQLVGGTLATSAKALAVNTALYGGGEAANLQFAAEATASLTNDLTVTSALTFAGAATLGKDSAAAADVVVKAAGTLTMPGTVTVNDGVTFDIGTNRPEGSLTVGDEATLAVHMASATDIPVVKVTAQPANVVLYDASGDLIDSSSVTVDYDSEAGEIAISGINTWKPTNGTSFDTAANWTSGVVPAESSNAAIFVTNDTVITVADAHTLAGLAISGAGVVSFTGEGSITASDINVQDGITLVKGSGANVTATTGIALESGCVLRLGVDGGTLTESAVISGDGAVETYGNVTMAAANAFTGGITAKSGTLSTTVANTSTSPWRSGFGPFSTGWDCDSLKTVVVEDGACVDIVNVANGGFGYKLVIEGKGVLADGVYSGAVKYTGSSAVTYGSRQISNLVLSDDAMIDIGAGWGLVHNDYGAAKLDLAGHTLTIRGTNKKNFPIQNLTAVQAGTIILDGSTLHIGYNQPCNLSGVDVIVKGESLLYLFRNLISVGSIVAAPTATGVPDIEGLAYITNVVPVVKTCYIDTSDVAVGDTLTLLTSDVAMTAGSNFTAVAGGRYTVTADGVSVKATVNELVPFLHYDFNVSTASGFNDYAASDSRYTVSSPSAYGAYSPSRNGGAMLVSSAATPWWNANGSGNSPCYAGEMSVTALMKLNEASNTILWNWGPAGGTGIALIAKDAATLALVSWTGGGVGSDLVSVTDIDDLVGRWHFVTVVAGVDSTTLYVDDKSATVATAIPEGVNAKGQLGSIHSNAKTYTNVSVGFYLDDWRVYDATLTKKEVRVLRAELNPPALVIKLR